ncbi:MAG: hypothetical protein M3R13_09280 [Armatimonadota bacterium]|nr:hypothetical protein [Armatimonadota bacterium]
MRVSIVFALVLLSAFVRADLVAQWKGNDIRDSVGRSRLALFGGAKNTDRAFDFSGQPEEVAFTPDSPELAITGSLSISCWVYPRAFVSPFATSPGSQIVFRGDDQSGLDPYRICLSRAGHFAFAIENHEGTAALHAQAVLRKWTHLLGTFDSKLRILRFYVDGRLAGETGTGIVPLGPLNAGYHPGVSIGNTQFPQGGVHRQPFDGLIRDVRIYNDVVSPRTARR